MLFRSIRMWFKFFFRRVELAWNIAWKEEYPYVFVYCQNCGSYHVRHYDKYEDEDKMLGIVRCDGGYVCEECGAKGTFTEKWSLKTARCSECMANTLEEQSELQKSRLADAMRAMADMEEQKRQDGKRDKEEKEEKFASAVQTNAIGYDPAVHDADCRCDKCLKKE